jgi:hypothetical protein
MDAPAVAVSNDGKKIAAAWMDMRAGKNDRDVQWTVGAGGKFAPETTVHDVGPGRRVTLPWRSTRTASRGAPGRTRAAAPTA